MMESLYFQNKMDPKNMMENTLGTFRFPNSLIEDSFNTNVSREQGFDGSTTTATAIESRRQLAMQLLEELDSSQNNFNEPYCNWLEEPMDLEVFGQSLIESSSVQLDEALVLPFIAEPLSSSPLASQPPTPIQPASPPELYSSEDDFGSNKLNEDNLAVPAGSEDLLESLLQDLSEETLQLDECVFVGNEDDITSALLDSLIQEGHVEESLVIDQLAQFSVALTKTAEDEQQTAALIQPALPNFISPVLCYSEPRPIEQKLNSRKRGSTPSTASTIKPGPPTIRQPRKKSLKPDDRRLRKKEQNKTAATRYRIKKKVELDILLEEESNLEQRNRQLQIQHDELANEVRYLKKLMREVFIRR